MAKDPRDLTWQRWIDFQAWTREEVMLDVTEALHAVSPEIACIWNQTTGWVFDGREHLTSRAGQCADGLLEEMGWEVSHHAFEGRPFAWLQSAWQSLFLHGRAPYGLLWRQELLIACLFFGEFGSPRHRHRHQEIGRRRQPHVPATIQAELPGLFAAEAQREEAVLAQEPDWADDSVRGRSLSIAVIKRNDQIVRLMHGSVDELTHFWPPRKMFDRLRNYRRGP